jgi:hypothetical protein
MNSASAAAVTWSPNHWEVAAAVLRGDRERAAIFTLFTLLALVGGTKSTRSAAPRVRWSGFYRSSIRRKRH